MDLQDLARFSSSIFNVKLYLVQNSEMIDQLLNRL